VSSLVGTEAVVEVGPVAHGGHCVARLDGRVVFVRHALPGERVRVTITEGDDDSRFLRGDAVAVLDSSPERVEAPCPYAGPGRCGGCDFQHADLAYQRQLKAEVVREQFQRLAHLEVEVTVEALPGDDSGLRWRSRVEFAVDADGRAGLRQHRSHAILPVADCLIADQRIIDSGVTKIGFAPRSFAACRTCTGTSSAAGWPASRWPTWRPPSGYPGRPCTEPST